MCVIHDSRKDKPYAGESHTVAPHFVFGSIGVRRFQPFSNLCVRLHFATGDGGVGLEYLVPEVHLLVGRFFCSEIRTPTVRKSLKAGAFRRSEPSDRVTALNGSGAFRYQCRLKLLRKGRVEFGVLSMVECISADAVTDRSIIEDSKKMFYYRGLSEWEQEPGYLMDTCLDGQDTFRKLMAMFDIRL